ncbi:hemicentin-1 isoform X3 [Nematostella vectensis]|uniref:hemicentin-1 isoform X3 n=1 Tax=Nematostella vectensis TaxID=45351 RepID=UPI0020778871|nr:hemicentin-1 isoform X3 [Nematostella vectensis]
MDLNAYRSILFLSICGLRFVDAALSWVSNPYNGNTVYAQEGTSYTFDWRFSSTSTRSFSQWQVTKPPNYVATNIATKTGENGPVQVASAYNGRVTFESGNQVGFRLDSLQAADNGRYMCNLHFADGGFLTDTANLVVVVRPQITSSTPSPVSLEEGQSKTLNCVASGNPTPTITWYHNNIQVQQTASVTTSNYEITNAGRDKKGTYRCEARVIAGSFDFVASGSIEVKVEYKPVVIELTANQSVAKSASFVEFFCKAEGEPAVSSYSWFKGQTTAVSPIANDNSKYFISDGSNGEKRLRVNTLLKDDAGWYTCAARNSRGLGLGSSTYLTVLYAPEVMDITFIPSVTVDEYDDVTLRCISDGGPIPFFTWRFKNENKVIQGSGDRGRDLVVSRAKKDDAGNYTCVATNSQGVNQHSELLYVKHAPTITTLSTGAFDNGVVLNQRATLTCSADGYPTPTYEIKKDATTVHGPGGNGVYVINSVNYVDEDAEWSCIPKNEKGQGPTKRIRITVQVGPAFVTSLPPNDGTKTENETSNYTCTADGKPAPDILWFVNGRNVTVDSPELGRVTAQGSVSPANVKLIRVESVLHVMYSWLHDGNISCVARNPAGSVQQTTLLQVRYCPVVKTYADHPKNVTLDEGGDATFSCRTIGNPVTDYVEWYFNEVKIPDSRGNSFTRRNVGGRDAGLYSCRGFSTLCNRGGPLFGAHLFIKTGPRITFYPKVTRANETGSALLYCRVTGVPEPVVTWYKEGNATLLHTGKEFLVGNLTYQDSGNYICQAVNSEATDRATLELVVQVVPVITTDKPTDTDIAGEAGKVSSIRCSARSEPPAEYWWTRGSDRIPLTGSSPRVRSINDEGNSRTLMIEVASFGETYYCHARNIMGRDIQKYVIREKGPPDAPIDIRVVGVQVPNMRTVDVNITWTPGYSGGFPQQFTVHHKRATAGEYISTVPDPGNSWTVSNLQPFTAYNFMVQSQNVRGLSPNSAVLTYITPRSTLPPARGTFTVVRNPDDATQVFLSWTVNENVTATYIQYREEVPANARRRRDLDASNRENLDFVPDPDDFLYDDQFSDFDLLSDLPISRQRRADDAQVSYGRWVDVQGAQGLSPNDTEFTVVNLDASKVYQFRVIFLYPGETMADITDEMWLESPKIVPLPVPGKRSGGLSTDELIAIIGGCGGVLLILLVILGLCCIKRRKKPYGAGSVEMSQASGLNAYPSYAAGGPDIARVNNDIHRSYAGEDVEDDPFIEAHIATLQAVDGKKKKKPEPPVNYGYASQDSFRPQEMLLNPGSRAGLRGMSRSMGQLEGSPRSSYSAAGPQRDGATTLPAYHEPPSFEEAIRQSGRKSKNKNRSTGDLMDPPGRLMDDSDESSDTDRYYRPPSKLKLRPPSSDEDPGYSSVDVLSNGNRRSVPDAARLADQGLLDRSGPYARPMKPPKGKRGPPSSTTSDSVRGPPPQYTAEDRASIPGIEDDYEPRDSRRRPISGNMLELEPDYRNDRLPDLPPRMPELHGSRGLMKEPLNDSPLPEPPSFLRDFVESDDEYVPPSSRSFTEPRTPTGRSRQPYVNIHGQLVRPGSQGSDLNRNEPEPEPEPRRASPGVPDDRNHEVGYVSSGFLV